MHGKCGVCLSTKILFVLTWTSLCEGTAFVDRVCTLAKSEGEKCPSGGGGEEKMYYFDSTKEKCTSFTYLGCAGNQNKFEASDDCIDSCQTPWFIKKNKEEDKKNPGGEEPHKKSDCSLPYEAGPCKALITMWYYNSAQAACEVFGYGGCNGNGNKFDSRLECETFCGDNPEVKKKSS